MRSGVATQPKPVAKQAAAPAATTPANSPPVETTAARKQEELVRWDVLGRSLENRVIEYAQFGNGKHRVLVIGALRGDEPEGVALAQALGEHLVRFPQRLDDVAVTIVRDPNPDGRIRRTPGNARGVDLDRNFISSGWRSTSDNASPGQQPESEPETRVLADLMVDVRPDRVVILGTSKERPAVDYSGPAEYLAAQVALELGGQASRSEPNATAGSLMTMTGVDRGIPTLSIGVPPVASADGVWMANKRGLMTAIGCGTHVEFVQVGPKPAARPTTTQAPSAADPPVERRSPIVSTAKSRTRFAAPPASTAGVDLPPSPEEAANPSSGCYAVAPQEEPQPLYYNQLRFGRPAVNVVSPRARRAKQGLAAIEQPTPAADIAPSPSANASFDPPFDPRIQRLPPAQLFTAPKRTPSVPAGMPQPPIPYPRTGY